MLAILHSIDSDNLKILDALSEIIAMEKNLGITHNCENENRFLGE